MRSEIQPVRRLVEKRTPRSDGAVNGLEVALEPLVLLVVLNLLHHVTERRSEGY